MSAGEEHPVAGLRAYWRKSARFSSSFPSRRPTTSESALDRSREQEKMSSLRPTQTIHLRQPATSTQNFHFRRAFLSAENKQNLFDSNKNPAECQVDWSKVFSRCHNPDYFSNSSVGTSFWSLSVGPIRLTSPFHLLLVSTLSGVGVCYLLLFGW